MFGVDFLATPPSLPTAALQFWFLWLALILCCVPLRSVLDTRQLVIIGIAVSCPNRLAHYF